MKLNTKMRENTRLFGHLCQRSVNGIRVYRFFEILINNFGANQIKVKFKVVFLILVKKSITKQYPPFFKPKLSSVTFIHRWFIWQLHYFLSILIPILSHGFTKCGTGTYRSSHRSWCVRKGALRNFAKFTGNTCARVSFLVRGLQLY